jgi:hypothetical protein
LRNHHGTDTISIEFSAAITHCSVSAITRGITRHQLFTLLGEVEQTGATLEDR